MYPSLEEILNIAYTMTEAVPAGLALQRLQELRNYLGTNLEQYNTSMSEMPAEQVTKETN